MNILFFQLQHRWCLRANLSSSLKIKHETEIKDRLRVCTNLIDGPKVSNFCILMCIESYNCL